MGENPEIISKGYLSLSFCGKYGSRNDTDDDSLSDGLELEIPPAVDVREGVVKKSIQVSQNEALY